MTFIFIMSGIILTGLGISAYFFRKGGIYNKMPSTDHITEIKLKTLISDEIATSSSSLQKVAVEADLSQKRPTLKQLCTAMRDFEGKPGDANYRNNNPLNCKFYYGGYLPIYEPVGISPNGFAVFKDYTTGWLYGFNMLKNKIKNHPEWTLRDLISNHAPAEDSNPVDVYTAFVAKKIGVDIHFLVKNLV